jgi:hypothetical protein
MDADILKQIKGCLKCQATKNNKFLTVTPLQPMPQCSAPNQHIYVDLFGLCKTSDMGNKYILTITYAFTKYAEFVQYPTRSLKKLRTWYSQNGFVDMEAHQSSTQMEGQNSLTKLQQNCTKNWTSKAHTHHLHSHNVTVTM